MGFTQTKVEKNFFTDSIPTNNIGKTISITDMYGPRYIKQFFKDSTVHDANFAFLTTTLAKLHKDIKEPKYNITWNQDVPSDIGGGFVDYIERYQIEWAGIMNEFRNVVGNNGNYVPRVNAGMTQKKVNVFTYEVAYDLRFVELEKMKELKLAKSIQEIYQNVIVAQWDLFVQRIAYTGVENSTGLFNDANVQITTIDNSTATGLGFEGMPDDAVVAFFNGVFAKYLSESNMNLALVPDTFLVPSFVGLDLTSRFSALYTETLRNFICTHNLAVAESDGKVKVSIKTRPALDELNNNKGRIVAYRNDKDFVRIDIPYPMQHYITLPNIEKMSYTSAFVGQVSEVQLPYNDDASSFGVVTYWDFTA